MSDGMFSPITKPTLKHVTLPKITLLSLIIVLEKLAKPPTLVNLISAYDRSRI